MHNDILARLRSGAALFIGDVRRSFESDPDAIRIGYSLVLPDAHRRRAGLFVIPEDLPDNDLVERYLQAEIYNLLTTLGGYELTLVIPPGHASVAKLVGRVVETFQIDAPSAERVGVARVVNVLNRMLAALHARTSGAPTFSIKLVSSNDLPAVASVSFSAEPTDTLSRVSRVTEGMLCGLDIGGTDIKAALVVDGHLALVKEHDWNPARMTEVEQVIDPIVDIVRIFRGCGSIIAAGEGATLSGRAVLDAAQRVAHRGTSPQRLNETATEIERLLGDALRGFDAVGLCFPDVVVRNKVVGGEVPKMIGIRSNPKRAFEEQFARLTDLDTLLARSCRPGGSVANTNDGPMAAFTAAVELAAAAAAAPAAHATGGVFAHTLGTDLGTGVVLGDGSIPEIPLEVYNLIVDLGSLPASALPATDVRSMRNTNTGVSGTLQRYASQTGAFRLAQLTLADAAPQVLDDARSLGFLHESGIGSARTITVPEEPVDMRKAYLAFLMERAQESEPVAGVFRTIGEALAHTWTESERILETGLRTRYLFGRLVKSERCFALLQEGARRIAPDLVLVAADGEMAYTPLMKELDALPEYTVAQFGQAIGAVYFAVAAMRPSAAMGPS